MDNNLLWKSVLQTLRTEMTQATFERCLAGTKGGVREGEFIVQAPDPYAYEWLDGRLRGVVERAVGSHGLSLPVRFIWPGAGSGPGIPVEPNPSDQVISDEIMVELIRFDPTQKGFVKVLPYALQFWQPYLKTVPFSLWLTLRSFGDKGYPCLNISALADMVAEGNCHRIWRRAGRRNGHDRWLAGAIEVLEAEEIVQVIRDERGGRSNYLLRVLDSLPLLSPGQVAQLPVSLQVAHRHFMEQDGVDYEAWQAGQGVWLIEAESLKLLDYFSEEQLTFPEANF